MVTYPSKTFVWHNLLWVCAGCNRVKGDRFDLDETGKPLLIDPASEDPWDFLFFEPRTGMITARIDSSTGLPDPKGQYTADLGVLPLNIEPVTEGRRRVYRSLRRAVQGFLERASGGVDSPDSWQSLLEEVRDHDEYGLVNWYFLRDGNEATPFSMLRGKHTKVWQFLVESLFGNQTVGGRVQTCEGALG
jgi:hypothetical protein